MSLRTPRCTSNRLSSCLRPWVVKLVWICWSSVRDPMAEVSRMWVERSVMPFGVLTFWVGRNGRREGGGREGGVGCEQ